MAMHLKIFLLGEVFNKQENYIYKMKMGILQVVP